MSSAIPWYCQWLGSGKSWRPICVYGPVNRFSKNFLDQRRLVDIYFFCQRHVRGIQQLPLVTIGLRSFWRASIAYPATIFEPVCSVFDILVWYLVLSTRALDEVEHFCRLSKLSKWKSVKAVNQSSMRMCQASRYEQSLVLHDEVSRGTLMESSQRRRRIYQFICKGMAPVSGRGSVCESGKKVVLWRWLTTASPTRRRHCPDSLQFTDYRQKFTAVSAARATAATSCSQTSFAQLVTLQ